MYDEDSQNEAFRGSTAFKFGDVEEPHGTSRSEQDSQLRQGLGLALLCILSRFTPTNHITWSFDAVWGPWLSHTKWYVAACYNYSNADCCLNGWSCR